MPRSAPELLTRKGSPVTTTKSVFATQWNHRGRGATGSCTSTACQAVDDPPSCVTGRPAVPKPGASNRTNETAR